MSYVKHALFDDEGNPKDAQGVPVTNDEPGPDDEEYNPLDYVDDKDTLELEWEEDLREMRYNRDMGY